MLRFLLSFTHLDFVPSIFTCGLQLNNHAKSENLTTMCFGKKIIGLETASES